MTLTQACANILTQLRDLVLQIEEQDFGKPTDTLSGSTIGQHLRHTLEFFGCLQSGYSQGVVNYDKRAHDQLIEGDKFLALAAIDEVTRFIEGMVDRRLTLQVGYDLQGEDFHTLNTTALRELVYNIEHAVHHMAIIKIGVNEVAPYIQLPPEFGIAASTIRYREHNLEADR